MENKKKIMEKAGGKHKSKDKTQTEKIIKQKIDDNSFKTEMQDTGEKGRTTKT